METPVIPIRPNAGARLQALLKALPRLETSFAPEPVFDDFQPFAKLAPELRNKIWRHVVTETRIIKLIPYNFAGEPRSVKGQPRQPGMLHANKEARSIGLEVYTKVLQRCCDIRVRGTQWIHPSDCHRNIVYINFDADRFHHGVYCIHSGMAPDSQLRPLHNFNFDVVDMMKIKYLDLELFREHFPTSPATYERLKPFLKSRALKECVFWLKRCEDLAPETLDAKLLCGENTKGLCTKITNALQRDHPSYTVELELKWRLFTHELDLAPATATSVVAAV